MQRKFSPIILLMFVSISSANCQTKAAVESVKSCKYLSLADAEEILGQKVELIENFRNSADGKLIFKCQYRTIEKDKSSGHDINLFFMLEESTTENQAKQIYQTIWNSNKNYKGIEVLKDTGDEAYSHSERPNFHFVMARKGKSTIRLKVNKAVETTSFEALKSFSGKFPE
jgi:hypothetical protein